MTCTDRIISVLKAAKRPLYLHEIQATIVTRWGEYNSETAISARIRDDVRNRLQRDRMTVLSRAPEGKKAHRYWLAKC